MAKYEFKKSFLPYEFSSVHQFKIQQRLNMIAKVSETYHFGVNFAQKTGIRQAHCEVTCTVRKGGDFEVYRVRGVLPPVF